MKITRLQAENFKIIKAIDIRPGGEPVVAITGRNGQGKSSTLDAIAAALGGKANMPNVPVRQGEDEGAIRLELDGGALVVRRTFGSDGKNDQLVIESAGEHGTQRLSSPQQVLHGLYASVAFDPLAFTHLKPGDQLDTLRRLVKLDVDVDQLAADRQAAFDKRTEVNRTAKDTAARAAAIPDYGDLPDTPIDQNALIEELTGVAEHNGEIQREEDRRQHRADESEAAKGWARKQRQDIEAKKAEIARLEGVAETSEELARTIDAELEALPPIGARKDARALQEKITEARITNARMQERDTKKRLIEEQADAESTAKKLTEDIELRDRQRGEAFGRAAMPVPGLSFGDGEVLFNGVPLEQASSAEQLRVSTAIGMAGNPKLRVMLVREGSLLDQDGQRILAEMAGENDFQLWVEMVDSSGKVGVVIEDGAVAGAETPEPIDKGRRKAASKAKAADAAKVASESQAEAVTHPKPGEPVAESSTLFQRMSDIARGNKPDDGDIPAFLKQSAQPPETGAGNAVDEPVEEDATPEPEAPDEAPGDPGEGFDPWPAQDPEPEAIEEPDDWGQDAAPSGGGESLFDDEDF